MNKVYPSLDEAVSDIFDGASISLGGFFTAGNPVFLIKALAEKGTKNLTIVSGSAGIGNWDINFLFNNKQVKKMICNYPFFRSASQLSPFELQFKEGNATCEVYPMGTFIEKLRAGAAGIPAFYVPTGAGTVVAEGKEVRNFNGKEYILEMGLKTDFSFIHAYMADTMGNVIFRKSAQNYNPEMAKASRITIVEAENVVEVGELDPDKIHLPGIFVQRVVKVDRPKVIGTIDAPPQGAFILNNSSEQNNEVAAAKLQGLSREQIAKRIAMEIRDGCYVNLGIGIPTLVSNWISGRDIILQSEIGILNCGPIAATDQSDQDLINASCQPLVEIPGTSYFSSSESFLMIRGGHMDVVVLGALQVSEKGDFAGWNIPAAGRGMIGNIGGSMDLAAGTKVISNGNKKLLIIAMEHTTKDGQPKIVTRCSYPLTARETVDMIVTNLAVIEVVNEGLLLKEIASGLTVQYVQSVTDAKLIISPELKEIEI